MDTIKDEKGKKKATDGNITKKLTQNENIQGAEGSRRSTSGPGASQPGPSSASIKKESENAFAEENIQGDEGSRSSTSGPGASQPGPSSASIKKGEHSTHTFKFRFDSQPQDYIVVCNRPCTVLQALQTSHAFTKEEKSDSFLIIQRFDGGAVAPHFPCILIKDKEELTIIPTALSGGAKGSKTSPTETKPMPPRDKYVTFNVDRQGGTNAKTRNLLKDEQYKGCDILCVYGVHGKTVQQALQQDGRFDDIVTTAGCYLSSAGSKSRVGIETLVDTMEDKRYKICLPKQPGRKKEDKATNGSSEAESPCQENTRTNRPTAERASHSDSAPNWSRLQPDNEGILEILRDQFKELKETMEKRWDEPFSEVLNLKKENFGKIRQSFSQVHRVKQLFNLGNSVCKVDVEGVCSGTGFVLFDHYVLTSAHLFEKCSVQKGSERHLAVGVNLTFNYENPTGQGGLVIDSKPELIDYQVDPDTKKRALDYAILELNLETIKAKNWKPPPGLLSKYGRVPDSGEACLIGHPQGREKLLDPTCVIERENRAKAVQDCKRENLHVIFTINDNLKKEDIENLMIGRDNVVTYNTFFFHGSSGSPVFDASGKVFALHTAGFIFADQMKESKSVIEYAHPLRNIMENFLMTLKRDKGKEKLLSKVKKLAQNNLFLEEDIFRAESDDMDTS